MLRLAGRAPPTPRHLVDRPGTRTVTVGSALSGTRGRTWSGPRPWTCPGISEPATSGLSVLRPGYGVALKASMPTKIGEFLASGRPVVVNAGLGDLDHLLTEYDCGVILPDDTPECLRAAADSIERLVADQDAPARCRKLAQDNFRLDTAIEHLIEIYKLAVNSL